VPQPCAVRARLGDQLGQSLAQAIAVHMFQQRLSSAFLMTDHNGQVAQGRHGLAKIAVALFRAAGTRRHLTPGP
jgi:hypothetical protein